MYFASSPKNKLSQTEARTKMMECAKEVKSFLTANKMKQNDGKTEFLILNTAGHKKYIFKLMTLTFVVLKYTDLIMHAILV